MEARADRAAHGERGNELVTTGQAIVAGAAEVRVVLVPGSRAEIEFGRDLRIESDVRALHVARNGARIERLNAGGGGAGRGYDGRVRREIYARELRGVLAVEATGSIKRRN